MPSRPTRKKPALRKASVVKRPPVRTRRREYLAILFLALAVFLFLCLSTYDPRDPSFNVANSRVAASNMCGLIGSHVADALVQVLGISSLTIPIGLLLIAFRLIFPRSLGLTKTEIGSVILVVCAVSALLERFVPGPFLKFPSDNPGGALGTFLHGGFLTFLGSGGEILVTGTIILLAALNLSRVSVQKTLQWSMRIVDGVKSILTGSLAMAKAAWERHNEELAATRYDDAEEESSPPIFPDLEINDARDVPEEPGQFEKEDYHSGQIDSPSWERLSWLPENTERQVQKKPESRPARQREERKIKIREENGVQSEDSAPKNVVQAHRNPTKPERETRTQAELEAAIDEYLTSEKARRRRDKPSKAKGPKSLSSEEPAHAKTRPIEVSGRADEKKSKRRSKTAVSAMDDDYRLPPIDLLEKPPQSSRFVDKKQLEGNAVVLEQKLSDLGIKGEVVAIHPGPVITMFELILAPGIPLRKVLNTADDLAMALKSGSTRVVAPIPGKDTVGIEVPNLNRETVYFREIIESSAFSESTTPLKIALGKGIDGEPFATSLIRMPHLLIAGATGTGKSVGLNGMICSWLMSSHPDDLKFIMVDPKKLELSYYQDIPHLLHPVVTEPEKVPKVLSWAIREMERRYELLSKAGAKNIEGYNEKVKSGALPPAPDGEEASKLPFIVIIVDELAELMMVAAKDVEISICRLAQMARAAGIHLILATQRPSVDVITGIIKANFPARLSFQVSAKADSRTIIDTVGAEHLLGKGDLLFLPPGTAKLRRLHGAFVSENEISGIVDYIKAQRSPVYLEEISKHVENESSVGSSSELIDDVKYDEAVELVTRLGHASISLIQRHMRIGYNRAARIIEAMESVGIIGPSDGTSRPREVLARALDHIPDTPQS
jgi:DNA segregation ATPase FtsK/SpoIIIE, S-DNA-T family